MTYIIMIVNLYLHDILFFFFLVCQTDELTWNTWNGITYGQQGKNISVKWRYTIEKKEEFKSSTIFPKHNPHDPLASRHKGESIYTKHLSKSALVPFSVTGNNDVTLTILNAELNYSRIYCCRVIWMVNSTSYHSTKCTYLFIDVPLRITSQTPDQTCKQGDSVKLQCNATGHPEQRVFRWIHRDTNKIIGNSSVTSLKITGKRSEGNYCCKVTNRFKKATKCTEVIVTEYGPVNTTLILKRKHGVRNQVFEIKCEANASPPPNVFQMGINTKQYNSTNGVLNLEVKNDTKNLKISCIPWNKYGQGTMKMITPAVYDSPKFTLKMPQWYNMTAGNVIIRCNATGNPKPNITWTERDTGEVVSTEEYYEVPYVKCVTKTLVYYCLASNALGSIKSKEITVKVLTKYANRSLLSCKVTDTKMNYKLVIIIASVPVVCCLAIWLVKHRFWKLKRKHQEVEESLRYGEPIDSIPIKAAGKEGSLEIDATIEDVYRKNKNRYLRYKEEPPSEEKLLHEQV